MPMDQPLPLLSTADRAAAQALVEGCDLRFEAGWDDLLGVFRDGRLAACGARAGRVLKMLVVAPEQRGSGLLGEVVGALMRRGFEAGCDGFFILTRPCTAAAFESLGFKLLVRHEQAVLLEHGNGLHRYLRKRAALARSGENAVVVINADPFSIGHQYLVARATTLADTVYAVVPSEGRFALPLADRLELARRGTAHLPNVVVTESGPYLFSAATFPAYFLKPGERAERLRLEIDVDLFGAHIAPHFHVRTRIAGSEPLDPASRDYNQILRQRLGRWGLRLVEIERRKAGEGWISTGRIRRALARGDRRQLEAWLPWTSLEYLQSLPPGAVAWRSFP